MNRNNERHFAQIPKVHISRSTFNRPQNILTTFDAGELVPFYVDEVLPGDTFRVQTSAIIRQTTPKYPVMDDAYIDIYYFYTPDRILWDDFKKFMGEAEDRPWTPSEVYTVPKIVIENNAGSVKKALPDTGSILDYMGVPAKSITEGKKVEVNALPVRAYVMIWSEFFRDQNIDNPAEYDKGNGSPYYPIMEDSKLKSVEKRLLYAQTGAYCLPVNKFHDYFTSCLPYPQRGPEVNIPMSGNAPVSMYMDWNLQKLGTQLQANNNESYLYLRQHTDPMKTSMLTQSNTHGKVSAVGFQNPTDPISDRAYLGANLSEVNATTINELRNAIAVQHYYEALARGGSRYREQVRALFGTEISDKTVQVPEYLGGGRYHVNMNQIVQTSGQQTANDTPIGETGAMSVTPINETSFTKSFEEHGFVLGLMCVRHDRTYQQGLERFWSRSDRLDYYFPQFANIGEQPVKKKEIMLTGTATDDETFGYQEAWADYRYKPNRVSGKMRSNAEGTLDFWHYADNYKSVPTLSQEWLKEGKTEIARTLIVQDEPQFFGAIRVDNKTTRPMPLYSVPGLEKL